MSNTYKLLVNQTNSFEMTESDLQNLDAVSVEKNKFHILKNNKPYLASIVSSDFLKRKYAIQVNNNNYLVTISNDLDILIQKMGIDRKKVKLINAIKAPMPGLILEINVTIGQLVKLGDPLLILEAMKMENIFTSPREGVIKSIAIEKGMAVDKGQLLIEFE